MIELRNQETKEITILTRSAVINPFTLKPGTNHAASKTINALMTKIKSPNVRTVIGKVRKTKIGFTTEFRIPKTIATMIIVEIFETTTPGTMRDAAYTATLLMRMYNTNLILVAYHSCMS